ncbi:MAG: hypothetical protein JW822_05125 [Spirochaetales bacterium]|nr:hypothetical protein [Spirochaetales bacterium]
MKSQLILIIITICLFIFSNCPAENNRSQSGLPATEQSADTVSANECKAADILPQVDALLAGHTFESHYLIIRNQFVLSIWLVIPELDPCATKNEVAANSRLAFVKGIRICHIVASQIPCVREVFNAINPMIVDKRYNCWYRDIIPLQNLPADQSPSDEELIQAVTRRDMKYSYSRTIPPRMQDYADILDTTAWKEFRASIQRILCKKPGRCNCAAYPMYLNDYCIVQVYWQALTEKDLTDTYALECMTQIAQSFATISLAITRLEMSVVNNDGKLAVYGKVDAHAFRSKDDGLSLKDEIRLYHMP